MIAGDTYTFVPSGGTAMDVPVFTVTDSIEEGNENFLLQITGVTGPAAVGTQSETNITIVDNKCKF